MTTHDLQIPVPGNIRVPARRLRGSTRRVLVTSGLLVLAAGLLIAYKLSGLPLATELSRTLSFERLPRDLHGRAEHLLGAPLGALIVVFVRLTLGLRVLGPFRSVLLAVAFQITGPFIGVACFVLVTGALMLIRPAFKRLRLPYFGKAGARLICVAGIIVLAMVMGMWANVPQIERLVYFPVVVLVLTGDAFASVRRREGFRAAMWRFALTTATALVIMLLASVGPVRTCMMRFPELVLVILAALLVTSKLLKFRLLSRLNPPPRRAKRKKRRAAAIVPAAATAAIGTPETDRT